MLITALGGWGKPVPRGLAIKQTGRTIQILPMLIYIYTGWIILLEVSYFQIQGTQKFSNSDLYTHYTQYCVENRVNVYSSNSRSFGIVFKDNIDFDGCGIEKKKSNGVMVYIINKKSVFEWLNKNNI
jgi:hypothetical protein